MINITALKHANPNFFSKADIKDFGASPVWQRAGKYIMIRSCCGKHVTYPVYAVNANLTLGQMVGWSQPGLSKVPAWDRIEPLGSSKLIAIDKNGFIIPL